MAFKQMYLLCLLCIFTCVSLSQRFNVEDYCSKRCLYGSGGVLCNCSPTHFKGKRLGPYQVPTNHLRNYAQFPRDHQRTWLSPDKIVYYGSPNSHSVKPFNQKDYNIGSEVSEGSLNRFGDVKLVPTFDKVFGVKNNKENPRYTKDGNDRNVNSLLPAAFLNEREKENNSESNDDEFVDTRREIASTIKQIMSVPMMVHRGRVGAENFNDEFVDDSNGPVVDDADVDDDDDDDDDDGDAIINHNRGHNNNNKAATAEEVGWRQHLRQLQKVMRNVRHLR